MSSHCVSMSAYSVPFNAKPAKKEKICRICKKNEEIIRSRFGFAGPDLEGLANDEDFAVADEMIRATRPEQYARMALDGVEVGRIALYEMLIQSKRGALDFNSEERLRYRANLKNVIIVLRVAQRLLTDVQPDRIVVYNALYSVNRVVCRLAEIRRVPQYYLHAGDNLSNRLQTLVLARDHAFAYYRYLCSQWSRFEDQPCPLIAMQAGTNHLLEVARGRSVWAYSAASGGVADLRKTFHVDPGQKVICATMSSDDERFGGEVAGVLPSLGHLLFPKQVDWIRALIEFVKNRTDLCLVIRVHPREFPNKRECVLSDHAIMLREAFATLPKNVKVNWPTENISLYDLAGITDVFANAWSSAGKEMAWLGVPVVLYSHELTLYPTSLNYVGTTHDEYFQQIERALNEGWDPGWIRKVYRWSAVEFYYSSLDISESFAKDENRPFFRKAFDKALRAIAPTWEQQRDCRDRAKSLTVRDKINAIIGDQLRAAVDVKDIMPPVSFIEETALLKSEVCRLVDGLFGAAENSRNNSLASLADAAPTAAGNVRERPEQFLPSVDIEI